MKTPRNLLFLLAVMSSAVSFGDNFYWVDGGGKWSEVKNWFMDAEGTKPATRYPGAPTNVIDDVAYYAEDDIVYFAKGANGTINIDIDTKIRRFFTVSTVTKDITFTGNGQLTVSETKNSAGERPQLNGSGVVTFKDVTINFLGRFAVDRGVAIFGSGANIKVKNLLYAWHNNAKAYFEDGCNIGGGGIAAQYSGASIIINGGNIRGEILAKANTKIHISGGNLNITASSIDKDADFIFTNGVLTATFTVTDSRLLGSEDAVFKSTVSPSGSNYTKSPSINVVKEDGEVVKCTTVFATNGNYSAFHFANEATLIAKTLNLSRFTIAEAKNVTLFADRINLGSRIFPTVNGASLTVPNGTTFGAFGDWYVYDKNFSLNLGGDVVFDTTDCFDGITPRNISVSKLVASPDLAIKVRGVGDLSLVFSDTSALKTLSIEDNASFTYTNATKCLLVDNLCLGDNSKVNLKCGGGAIEVSSAQIASTAKIYVHNANNLSNIAYPLIIANDESVADAITPKITFVDDVLDGYNLCKQDNCIYLTNNEQPVFEEIGKSNIWCGANGGYWNDIKNWLGEKRVPNYGKYVDSGVSNHVYITGTRNTEITNNMEGTVYLARIAFLKDCGPARLTGGKFNLGSNGYRNVDTTPISSSSKFPVIIDSEIFTTNSFGATVASDSYMVFNGALSIVKILRPCGDIRVGGNISCAQVLLDNQKFTNGRVTQLHVLNGGTVTASAQITNQTSALSCYVIDENGKLVFEDGKTSKGVRYTCGHLETMKPSLINGLMDIQCPYFTIKNQYYHGTGEIRFGSVQSDVRGSSSVIVGGGLMVKPASWTTVTANAPDNYIKLAVTTNAILSAAANWTYGPALDVVPTTEATDRALELAEDSTLTIRSAGYQISFADPIIGPGNVVVEEGSKIALAGELLDSAKGGWTTFATVASFTCPETAHSSTLKFKFVDNEDGTVDVQARIAPALVISIR